MGLAQGQNTVTPVRFENAAPQYQVKHSTNPFSAVNSGLKVSGDLKWVLF